MAVAGFAEPAMPRRVSNTRLDDQRPQPTVSTLFSRPLRRLLLYSSVLALAGVIAAGHIPASARSQGPVAAPAFVLPARTGGTASLDSLRGKVVLVDFWASWCGPCRQSFPWMASMAQRYGAKGLTVVAINLDKEREDAEVFLSRFPAPFAIAFDPAGKTAEAYKVNAMPTSFLVDRTGTIVYSHAGFVPRDTAAVEQLIAAALAK